MVSTRGVRYKFTEGERVLCYEPDPTKAKVLYDSKVLEVIESKDKRGRRVVEYLIHFQGWNSSWDRCVGEDFVLKDTEENRQLQRDLAEKSQLQLGAYLYRRERKKGSTSSAGTGPAKRSRQGFSDDGSSSSTQPDEAEGEAEGEGREAEGGGETGDTDSSSGSGASGSQPRSPPPNAPHGRAHITLPAALRDRLTFDYHLVVKRGRLSRLPASPSAAQILESFVKWFARAGAWHPPRARHDPPHRPDLLDVSCRLNLVREVADGLRVYFDYILRGHLLYKQELNQYHEICGQFIDEQEQRIKEELEDEDHMSQDEGEFADGTNSAEEDLKSPKIPEYSHLPPDPVYNEKCEEHEENGEEEDDEKKPNETFTETVIKQEIKEEPMDEPQEEELHEEIQLHQDIKEELPDDEEYDTQGDDNPEYDNQEYENLEDVNAEDDYPEYVNAEDENQETDKQEEENEENVHEEAEKQQEEEQKDQEGEVKIEKDNTQQEDEKKEVVEKQDVRNDEDVKHEDEKRKDEKHGKKKLREKKKTDEKKEEKIPMEEVQDDLKNDIKVEIKQEKEDSNEKPEQRDSPAEESFDFVSEIRREIRPHTRRGNLARRLRSHKSAVSQSENDEPVPSTSAAEPRAFEAVSSSVGSSGSSMCEGWPAAAPAAAPAATTRTPLSLLLEKVAKWQIIPREGTEHLPCRVYGAIHLARLFVRLPDFLNATQMPDFKLKLIVKHIDMFVQYLDEHREWFGEPYYFADNLSRST